MSIEKYALLVIDMQLVAFDGKITPPITNGSELLARIAGLIDICRSNNVPIVYLQTCAVTGQPYAKDVHGWEIHPDLSPLPDDTVVNKVQSNGFEDTALHDVLTELGVDTLITCGIWSEFCVTATSKAGLELGYKVWVVADGHGTVAASEEEARVRIKQQNDELTEYGIPAIEVPAIGNRLLT